MVELSDEEEVTERVCTELHVIPLCSVLILGEIRCIRDTKEDVNRSFLSVIAQTESVSGVNELDDDWYTSGLFRRTG